MMPHGLGDRLRNTTMTTAVAIPAQVRALQHTLDRGGWTILAVEIDLVRSTARVEVKRDDGLHVTLDARNGSATLTRELVSLRRAEGPVGSGRWRPERLHTEFIGRQRFEGPRAALRGLCNYLADNAIGAPMLRADVRKAMSLVM